MDLYTDGSLGAFAKPTNVNLTNRFICYDISELSPELKTIGMMIILEQIWSRVTANRARGKRTWLYVDEFHMLFRTDYTADYFLTLYKRARKWGLMCTGITQNMEELLGNQAARLMLANSDFLMLLNQSATDGEAIRHLLQMSEEQRDCFTAVAPGEDCSRAGRPTSRSTTRWTPPRICTSCSRPSSARKPDGCSCGRMTEARTSR